MARRSRARAEQRSDLSLTPEWLNPLLELPMRIEAALIRAGLRLPAGLSLLAGFSKPATLRRHADDHGSLARPGVGVEEHHLLPGSEKTARRDRPAGRGSPRTGEHTAG